MKKIAMSAIGLLILSLGIYSCTKENSETNSNLNKTGGGTGQVAWNIIYNGVSHPMEGTYDNTTGQVAYNSQPADLMQFGQDTNTATVTHAIIYEDRTDIYLYDNIASFEANVQFHDADSLRTDTSHQNRDLSTRSFKGAQCETYDGLTLMGTLAISWGSTFRSITNPNWHKVFFNRFWGYAQSIPWVGSWENDRISSLRLWDFNTPNAPWANSTVERVHFMGCQHHTWGGSRLYITLAGGRSRLAPVGAYPFKLWGWLPFGTWDNCISSYEIVQANVWVGGHTI